MVLNKFQFFSTILDNQKKTDLKVPIRILCGRLEPADRTDLDGVGSRVFSWLKTKLLSMKSLTKGAQAGCAPPVLHPVLPRGGW